jgi:uncharacterized GH25 family protein
MHTSIRHWLLALAALAPLTGHAHKSWLLPSETITTENQWVTVDAAVSDELFYFDHVPLRLTGLAIVAPDGSKVMPQNTNTGKYRSTFDVHLQQKGTYRLQVLNQSLLASYEENGTAKRWRGPVEKFASEVPAAAKNLQVNENTGRVETFVTVGKPTTTALKPGNVGLEMMPVTHPNDLYAGEQAQFSFLLDGKPAKQLPVRVVPGGTRYRDRQNEMSLVTDDQGRISVTWPASGMYWLEASLQDANPAFPKARQRRLSYIATFEVLPQ